MLYVLAGHPLDFRSWGLTVTGIGGRVAGIAGNSYSQLGIASPITLGGPPPFCCRFVLGFTQLPYNNYLFGGVGVYGGIWFSEFSLLMLLQDTSKTFIPIDWREL